MDEEHMWQQEGVRVKIPQRGLNQYLAQIHLEVDLKPKKD